MQVGNSSPQLVQKKSLFSAIAVEPVVLFYVLPSTINSIITQNLLLEQSCRVDLGYNTTVCEGIVNKDANSYTKYQEMEVQKLASQMIYIKTLIGTSVPLFLMLFLGAWSDKHGRRKPCILGPIIGELVAIICLVLNVIFLRDLPVLLTSLLYSLPMALSGGLPCLLLGAYSYVSTTSHEEVLTMRIGGLSAIQSIGIVFGIGIASIVLKSFGFIGAYSTIFFMMLSALIYGYYIVEDKTLITDLEKDIEQLEKAPKKIIRNLFKIEHFVSAASMCFRTHPSNRKMNILVLLILLLIVNGPLQGEQAILYLYTKLKFGWNEINFGSFYILRILSDIVGTTIALVFLLKYLKLKDASLGIISLSFSLVSCAVFGLAQSGEAFFMGALFQLFNGTSLIVIRSLLSKVVTKKERGTVHSLYGICETSSHLVFGVFYAKFYSSTIHFSPESIFYVSFALKCIGILLFIWLNIQTIDTKEKKDIQELKAEPNI